MTLDSGKVVTQDVAYSVTAKAHLEKKLFESPIAKFSVKFEGLKKSKADHAFIEIKHKTKKDVVFYQGDYSFTKGVYTFKNAKLDSKTEVAGEYEVNAVIVDSTLEKEV